MRIALLITGRAARYDACLLPILQNTPYHNIDIFMSINDEPCEYYDIMQQLLAPYLKGLYIKKYEIPKDIFDIFNENESIATHKMQVNLQKINGKFVPNNCLSMYYNAKNAFNMATEYADKNGFEYDTYMQFRSDIMNFSFPENIDIDSKYLHSAIPLCNFTSGGIYKKPIVCDAIAYGIREIMKIYCNTYDFVIKNTLIYSGKYYIAFECSLTDNIYDNNIPIKYHSIPYSLDKNRRIFDDILNDSRGVMHNQTVLINITDANSTNYIPPEEQGR
jgi:hypothetical protein